MSISVFATSDQKQIITYYSTSEKSTIATLKSPVTSTFDNMKSSTTSLTTQANLNATSVESSPKSDNSTIKPNDNFIKGIYIRFVSIQHLIFIQHLLKTLTALAVFWTKDQSLVFFL